MANTRVRGRNHKDKLGQSMQTLVAIVKTLDNIPYVMGSQDTSHNEVYVTLGFM